MRSPVSLANKETKATPNTYDTSKLLNVYFENLLIKAVRTNILEPDHNLSADSL